MSLSFCFRHILCIAFLTYHVHKQLMQQHFCHLNTVLPGMKWDYDLYGLAHFSAHCRQSLPLYCPVATGLWKLMATELWSLTRSCVHGNVLVHVHACVYGIIGCQIPQILGLHLYALDLLTYSVAMPWYLPFPLYVKAVSIWFEQDPVPRTSILLPVYLPVLAPCK